MDYLTGSNIAYQLESRVPVTVIVYEDLDLDGPQGLIVNISGYLGFHD